MMQSLSARPVAGRDLDLVGRFYEALVDPTLFGVALEELGEILGALGGSIHILAAPKVAHKLPLSARSSWVCSYGLPVEVKQVYEEQYLYSDPWRHGEPGNCYRSSDLIEPSELVKTGFYADLLRPIGVADCIGAVALHERSRCSFRVAFVGREFDDSSLGRFRLFMPHISRCLELQRRMRRDGAIRQSLEEAVQRLPCGMVWLDANGCILQANRFADRIISTADGLTAGLSGLHAAYRDDDRLLSKTIAAVLEPASEQDAAPSCVRVRRPSGNPAWMLIVLPTQVGSATVGDTQSRATVYVLDAGGRALTSEALLRRMFALTPSEARLAILIGQGMVPKEASDQLGISWNTARCQLRQVFSKTGTDRQASLVRLLASLGLIGDAGIASCDP